jgi:hypothetical protein
MRGDAFDEARVAEVRLAAARADGRIEVLRRERA